MASSEPESPLPYERPPPVSRWQFRVLLILVLLNLVVTLQTAYAPGASAYLRQRWAAYQEARRVEALRRQVLAWKVAPDKVVWEEDPEKAKALLGSAGYKSVQIPQDIRYGNYPAFTNWPPGAAAKGPAVADQLIRNFPLSERTVIPELGTFGVAFLHGLRANSGEERLVYVLVEGSMTLRSGFENNARNSPPTAVFDASADKALRLVAVPWDPGSGGSPPRFTGDTTVLRVSGPRGGGWPVTWHWLPAAGGMPPEIRLDPQNQFRFFAGQPDPADPSHFTLDYDLDGKRGTIDGRLKSDGKVALEPREGTVTGEIWVPRATQAAPTQ